MASTPETSPQYGSKTTGSFDLPQTLRYFEQLQTQLGSGKTTINPVVQDHLANVIQGLRGLQPSWTQIQQQVGQGSQTMASSSQQQR